MNFRRKPSENSPFPAGTLPENARNSTQESVPDGTERIRSPDPFNGNTASMKSPEYHGTGRFRAGLFDLGSQLMDECLSNGPFSMTSTKQCEFIRLLASSCNEFENDVSN